MRIERWLSNGSKELEWCEESEDQMLGQAPPFILLP